MERIEREAFLAHATLPTFKRKVEKAKEIIREALAIAPAYVAVSWGKDSVVMLHLVQLICPDILAIHIRTPQQELLENFEETSIKYFSSFPTNYSVIDIGMEETISHAAQSLKLWESYPLSFIGLRAEENQKTRGRSAKKYGYIHKYESGKKQDSFRCCPLLWWTWQDIWAYTCLFDLPYLASYDNANNSDKSQSRTTNLMMFGGTITGSRRHGRIEQLRILHSEAYQFLQQYYPEVTK